MQQNYRELSAISDWPDRAEQARYQASTLAEICGVSSKGLERFFKARMGVPPQTWLNELRSIRAAELIRRGLPRKQIASLLGYNHASNLCRAMNRWNVRAMALLMSSHLMDTLWSAGV